MFDEKVPKPDLSFFGKDTDFFDTDSTDKKDFEDKEYPKFVADFLTETLGEGGFTDEMLKVLSEADLNQLVRDLQQTIGNSITKKQIQTGIKLLTGAK